MAEGTSLLRTRTRKGTVGSNPTLSAFFLHNSPRTYERIRYTRGARPLLPMNSVIKNHRQRSLLVLDWRRAIDKIALINLSYTQGVIYEKGLSFFGSFPIEP